MRVLAIDGGGIRGLIPALVLAEIEARTGRRTAELFDLVAGTSTGGILACALTRRDAPPAADVADLYVSEGPKIFDRSLVRTVLSAGGILDERYDDVGLVDALKRFLGGERLADTQIPIFVTAYDIERRRAAFFRTGEDDVSLVEVAHATSAAPSYFEPVRVGGRTLIDGGVFAANPSLCAYVDLVRGGHAESLTVLASLGTGEAIRPYRYEDARGWGQLGWARPVIDVMLSSQAETVGFGMESLLGPRYVRLTRRLEFAKDDLDDASPRNLTALRREAELLIAGQSPAIDALCTQLTSSG